MISLRKKGIKSGIARAAQIVIVVVIILIIAVGAIGAVVLSSRTSSTTSQTSSITSTQSSTTPSSSTTTSSSTSSTSAQGPSTFTYETLSTPAYLDPQVSYSVYDYYVMANEFESLIYFNGTSASNVIPWLAQNYTISPDGRTVNFTLRSNISFADGEPLNSTAVYFSLNRLLIEDGSSSTSHGTQASWVLQQLLNASLSTAVSGIQQPYTKQWVSEVLGQNFVQVTGPLTFSIHIMQPTAAFKYMIELPVGEDNCSRVRHATRPGFMEQFQHWLHDAISLAFRKRDKRGLPGTFWTKLRRAIPE